MTDASAKDICPSQGSSGELNLEGNGSGRKSPSEEVMVTPNSLEELKEENDSCERKSPSEGATASSKEREMVVEIEQNSSVSKAMEAVVQDDATDRSSDLHSNIESGANRELTSERTTNDTGLTVTCFCSREASSSTSACLAEGDSEGDQRSLPDQAKVSM